MRIIYALIIALLISSFATAVPYDRNALNRIVPQINGDLMATGYFENVSMCFNTDHSVDMWMLCKTENRIPAMTALLGSYANMCTNVEGIRDLTIYIGNQELSFGHWTCKREWIDFWPKSLSNPSDALAAAAIVTEVQKTISVEQIGTLPNPSGR
jgi:hypothetical protein